jgi:dTDP-4-amino-4,6-dideoxygalactose transaminase
MTYNPWPIGQVPKHLQRRELEEVKKLGYRWKDPRDLVTAFEEDVARYAGSKYAVSVDCCSHGIFLSLTYLLWKNELRKGDEMTIPRHTYISVPMQIMHAGLRVRFIDKQWSGIYNIQGSRVWDGAVRWTEGMYVGGNALQVVSFQIKKRLPIGKGGMILTDDPKAYRQLKLMSYDGRDLNTPYDDPKHLKTIGYHMYMSPEDCARGIILMKNTPLKNEDSGGWDTYPDVEQMLSNV